MADNEDHQFFVIKVLRKLPSAM